MVTLPNKELELTILSTAIAYEDKRGPILELDPKVFYDRECRNVFLMIRSMPEASAVTLTAKSIASGNHGAFIDAMTTEPVLRDITPYINDLKRLHYEIEIMKALEKNDGDLVVKLYEKKKQLSGFSENIIYKDAGKCLIDLHKNGFKKSTYSTGITDQYGDNGWFSIIRNQVTTVTGIPRSGKSNVIDQMNVNLAYKYNIKTIYISPENQPIELHVLNIGKKYLDDPILKSTSVTEDSVNKTSEFINKNFRFINTNVLPMSLDFIIGTLVSEYEKFQFDNVVIDPWNHIELEEGLTETQFVSKAYGKLRALSHNLNCHIFVVAHPRIMHRAEKGIYEGKYPPATLYDISGSANFFNKTDNGFSVWRDKEKVEIHIQKIKFEKINGEPGKVDLSWEPKMSGYRQEV